VTICGVFVVFELLLPRGKVRRDKCGPTCHHTRDALIGLQSAKDGLSRRSGRLL
jgi:hypothetical protein